MMNARASARTALASLALLAVPAIALAQSGSSQGSPIDDDPAAREAYLVQQRAYPYDKIPPRALQNARLQASRLVIGGPSHAASIDARWTSIGPAAISTSPTTSGRVTAIAIGSGGALFVGAAQGGVWRSTDDGASWTALTDNECSLAVGSITIDPVNPNIIYVGTGEPNFSGDSYYGCGILRSTDGGNTWANLGSSVFSTSTGGARIAKIIIAPNTAGTTNATLYAATSFGLYRSSNGGTTWTQTLNVGYGFVSDLLIDASAPATLYAAAASPYSNGANGIYKSVDNGITWTKLAGGLPTSDVGRIALAMASTGAIYAAVEAVSSGNLLGIWKSADGGVSWAHPAGFGAFCSGQCWYNMAINVDPGDESIVYFSGFSLYRSADGANGFTNIGNAIHVDHHALAFDPSSTTTIYAGSDGGIFRSRSTGANWESLNANLAITQFYAGISLHPTNAFPILGGAQDNGTLQFDGNVAWPPVFGGDGGYTATNPLNPGMSFVETQWIASSGYSGPRRRDTPTSSYQLRTNGIALNDPALFIPPLVLNPARPAMLYFGTNRVYRTQNNGDLWTPISGVISNSTGRVSAIGVSTSDSLTVYAGTSDGVVRVTQDGGTNWVAATGGVPNRFISDIVVNPAHPEIAWLSVSGFGSVGGHVFKTLNRGLSWTSANGNLPDVPVNALVQIPGGDLFAGTDLGVYRSADGGATWTKPAPGLPNIAVFDLAFNRATSTIIAATHGRSMFSLGVVPVITASQLVADSPPTTAQVGVTVPPIRVSVRETAGYLVNTASDVVTVRLIAGSATLGGTTTATAVNGVATFSDLVLSGQPGTQLLTFSAPGLDPATIQLNTVTPIALALGATSRRQEFPNGSTLSLKDSTTVTLTGTDAATTTWTATKAKAWTTLLTASGTGSGILRWTRSTAGFPTGTYVDTITVTVLGATGSPARLIDSLVVLPPAAFAYFRPDTVRGANNDASSIDLVADVSSLTGTLIGSYATAVTWDSAVVRLDSVRAAPSGFASPTVNVVNAGEVRLASAQASGMGGAVSLARFFFHVANDTTGRHTAITPAFTELTSTASVNLLPGMSVRPATGVVAPGVLRGDVTADGRVTAADAQAVLQAVVGLALPSGFRSMPNGDANCSGTLQAVDAQVILSFVVGLPVAQFCVGTVR